MCTVWLPLPLPLRRTCLRLRRAGHVVDGAVAIAAIRARLRDPNRRHRSDLLGDECGQQVVAGSVDAA